MVNEKSSALNNPPYTFIQLSFGFVAFFDNALGIYSKSQFTSSNIPRASIGDAIESLLVI